MFVLGEGGLEFGGKLLETSVKLLDTLSINGIVGRFVLFVRVVFWEKVLYYGVFTRVIFL